MAGTLTQAQRAELRRIAADSPPAIRRRLNVFLADMGRGETRRLDAYLDAEAAEVAS